jgi:hypothetical protein
MGSFSEGESSGQCQTIASGNNAPNEATIWIPFQYEKVPKFCFKCGVIYHGVRGCTGGIGGKMAGSEYEYGPWLHVPTKKPWLERKRWWEKEEPSSVGTGKDKNRAHSRSE